MDWYKHDIGSFRRKTHGLSAMEEGIYRRLLDEYYAGSGPLPDDPLTLRSLARIRTKWEVKVLSKIVDTFFPLGIDGLRHNKRADEEISEYVELCKRNKENRKQRVVNEPSTTGLPVVLPSERSSKTTKNGPCSALNGNGKTCGVTMGTIIVNHQWYCREHHPILGSHKGR